MASTITGSSLVEGESAVRKASGTKAGKRVRDPDREGSGRASGMPRDANDGGFPLVPTTQPGTEAMRLREGILVDGGLEFLRSALRQYLASAFADDDPQADGASPDPAPFADGPSAPTPESTADGIAGLALGLFPAYRRRHAGEAADAVRAAFTVDIRRRAAEGFAAARSTLRDMGLLDGVLSERIERTEVMVESRLASALDDDPGSSEPIPADGPMDL